jgi:hypothetical protein
VLDSSACLSFSWEFLPFWLLDFGKYKSFSMKIGFVKPEAPEATFGNFLIPVAASWIWRGKFWHATVALLNSLSNTGASDEVIPQVSFLRPSVCWVERKADWIGFGKMQKR